MGAVLLRMVGFVLAIVLALPAAGQTLTDTRHSGGVQYVTPTTGAGGTALSSNFRALAARSPGISVRDPAYGAVGDGVNDDTAEIQAAIDAAAAAGVTCYIPASELFYLISDSIILGATSRVIAEPGATLYLADASWSNLTLLTDTNVLNGAGTGYHAIIHAPAAGGPHTGIYVEGLSLNGNGGNQGTVNRSYAGISLANTTGAVLNNVSVSNVGENFTQTDTDANFRAFCLYTGISCTEFQVLGGLYDNAGYDAVRVGGANCARGYITGATIKRGHRTALQVTNCSNIEIIGCVIDNTSAPDENSSSGGFFSHGATRVRVASSVIRANLGAGAAIFGDSTPTLSSHVSLDDCTVISTAGNAYTQTNQYTAYISHRGTHFESLSTGGVNCILFQANSVGATFTGCTAISNGTAATLSTAAPVSGIRWNGGIIKSAGTNTGPVASFSGATNCGISNALIEVTAASAVGVLFTAVDGTPDIPVADCWLTHCFVQLPLATSAGAPVQVFAVADVPASRIKIIGNHVQGQCSSTAFYCDTGSTGGVDNCIWSENIVDGTGSGISFAFRASGSSTGELTYSMVTNNDFRDVATAVWGNMSKVDDTTNRIYRNIMKSNAGGTADDNQLTNQSGTATVTTGNTSIAFDHDCGWETTATVGVDTSPQAQIRHVRITPTNNLGAASHFWLTRTDHNTFVINVDADPGGDATFAWEIRMED